MVHVTLDLKGKGRSVLLLLLLSVSPTSGADSVRIEVRSSWTGLQGKTHSTVVIAGGNSKYSANGRPVAAEAVQSLYGALEEPPIEKPSLENCGIDARWLNANLEMAQRDFYPIHPYVFKPTPPGLSILDTAPAQITQFRSHFTDFAYVRQAFEHDFKGHHFDDYPEMRVEVWRDGKKMSVHSNSQHLFMLPWIVDGNPKRVTFNCHISHSIANLLPSTFTNRERLLPGHDFRWVIAQEIGERMRHLWDTEETLGPDVARIRARFTVLNSDVSCSARSDASAGGDNCLSWNADLKAPNLPAYMHLDVNLTYNNGRLVGVDQFLARIEDYVALVRSIPWLAEFMSQHSNYQLQLRYGGERSLSRKVELSDLERGLRDQHKSKLVDRLVAESDKCALLQIGDSARHESKWVVFPNREMLLWWFDGDPTLKWKTTQLDGWDCDVIMRCTGVVVQPNGTLAPP
jgi:hypothetical protein